MLKHPQRRVYAIYACIWRILVGAHLHLASLSKEGHAQKQTGNSSGTTKNRTGLESDLVVEGTPPITWWLGKNLCGVHRVTQETGLVSTLIIASMLQCSNCDFHIFPDTHTKKYQEMDFSPAYLLWLSSGYHADQRSTSPHFCTR